MASGAQVPPTQQQPAPQQSAQMPHQQVDFDQISRYKMMLPRLKESLVNLIKLASQAFRQNASVDGGNKMNVESLQPKFERCLEDLFAICDQMEIILRLAQEASAQIIDGNRFTPIPVVTNKTDNQDGQSQSYPQYQSTVRGQISTAKEIHDLLKRTDKS
ncbi:mediator of RNA polymerase II transcription subunit 29-like [Octopus sinensis]|uniref:Mediator of RNA polymerase II transcription subunit 29 n=1 Tax=Octopus sinensis TaxID=2607531 RepID=A0A6P7SV89_9MOLL|nr:mediator of RNA polymerase II transcription subunit 29-like [Octopus sinensis]